MILSVTQTVLNPVTVNAIAVSNIPYTTAFTLQMAQGKSVLQGATTDGKYIYACSVDTANNLVELRKFDLQGNLKGSKDLGKQLGHCNDMTYNSKINRLVVAHYSEKKYVIVNPDDLSVVSTENSSGNRVDSICYNADTDKYVVNGGLYSSNFTFEKSLFDQGTGGDIDDQLGNGASSGARQGIYCDNQNIYVMRTPISAGKAIGDNTLIAKLDWDGKIVAAYKIGIRAEAESMFGLNGTLHIAYNNGNYVKLSGGDSRKDTVVRVDSIKVGGPSSGSGSCDQRRILSLGIPYYDCSAVCSTSNPGDSGILAFAKQPIDSDFGISDSAAEQWFLGTGARALSKYGLNSSNIGEVTAAIKAAGVSVPFFYAYTLEEGSTLGGFINHYGSDTSGGAVGNATRDATYLANQSKIMTSNPAWVDVGTNNLDFVPKDTQSKGNADFQSMPSGTIGRAYIPATAATTWEVYYPDGLKKEFNKIQDYGTPLQHVIDRVTDMGGDPAQSGSGSGGTCTNNSDLSIANGDIAATASTMAGWGGTYAWAGGHGSLDDLKNRIDKKFQGGDKKICNTTTGSCPDVSNEYGVDCSGFMRSVIYIATGTDIGSTSTATMPSNKYLTKLNSKEEAKPGDIFLTDGHTGIITENDVSGQKFITAEARSTKTGIGPSTQKYSNVIAVYRYNGSTAGGDQ
jgi:cell wall-associated NlpC family hydrolase